MVVLVEETGLQRSVRLQLVRLGERQSVHGHFGRVIKDRETVARRVAFGRPVGHLHQQAARSVDELRHQVVRGDQMGVDGQAEDTQALVQVMLPDRLVPIRWPTLAFLSTPDGQVGNDSPRQWCIGSSRGHRGAVCVQPSCELVGLAERKQMPARHLVKLESETLACDAPLELQREEAIVDAL